MLFVMLAWMAQVLLLSGLGWPIHARLGCLQSGAGWSPRDFFRSFWIGFGVLLAVTQFYSLLFPLNGLFLMLAAAVALPGLCLQVRAAWARRSVSAAAPTWRTFLFWMLLVLCALRIAAGLGMVEWGGAYDSDLYHFGAVRWAKEYPAVPGLANLFSPLGLNSTYLLYAAIVDHGCWYRHAAWIVPGVFVLLFVAQLLWTCLCDPAALQRTRVCALLLLGYAALQICGMVPSLYYDRPAALCLCVALLELVQLAPGSAPARETMTGLFVMLLLAAVSVSIKPVGLISAALLGALGVVLACRLPWRAAWLWVLAVPAALALGMLARNAILSGWLLYPVPHGQLAVSWAVPERSSSTEAGAVMHSVGSGFEMFRAWARQPGPNYRQALGRGIESWLPAWWEHNRNAIELKLLGGGLFLLVLGLWPGSRRVPFGLLHFAVLLTGANLVFWFCTAPDLRFGEGYFWLWFALAGTLALLRLGKPQPMFALAGMLAFAALLLARPGWAWPEKIGWWHIGHACEARYHTVTIHNGQQPALNVLVPDNDDRMGDAPLPNTPYPQDSLCCRVPGDLRHGFYVAPPAATP